MFVVVPATGLEPARTLVHQILSLARLPISSRGGICDPKVAYIYVQQNYNNTHIDLIAILFITFL